MGGRGAGGSIGIRDLTDSFGYFPNNAYLCGPQKVWGSHFLIVKPLTIKTVDTLSYKTVSLNKATVNKEWLVIDPSCSAARTSPASPRMWTVATT